MASRPEYAYCEILKARIDEMRPFPPETLRSLKEYYRVGLTFSSNALEGNSLTESETRLVIEDGLTVDGKPVLHACEAMGHADAYNHLYEISVDKPLELADILKLPDHVYPLAYLCMGYVSEFLDQPELEAKGWRSRLPLEELVHRNGWGAGLDDEALLEQLKQ